MSQVQILFINPNQTIQGENKSKLLSPDCTLYQYVKQIHTLLSEHGIIYDARPPHITIADISDDISSDIKASRANQLHGTHVPNYLNLMVRKAVVIYTGNVEEFGTTHVTVAYFKEELTKRQFEILKMIVNKSASIDNIHEFKTCQVERMTLQTKVKKQDWFCETCQFTIFASKSECRKCGTKRPT